MDQNEITILLVDDHSVLREGLRALLESEESMRVVGEAGTGAEGIEMALALEPAVIVMDLGLPDMSGLEAIRAVRKENGTSRIIVLSMHNRREFVLPAMEAGGDGFIPKSSTHSSLFEAIESVLRGERYLHPKAATVLLDTITGEGQTEADLYKALSEREQEVLQLSAMGFTSREIGEQLFLSPKTIDTYRQRAMEKLALEHRSDVIRFALRAGVLDELKQ